MKQILFSFFLLFSFPALAQETLIGLTNNSGDGSASMFRSNTDGSNFYITHGFEWPLRSAEGALLVHSNGKLYGITSQGATGGGSIFSINRDGTGFEVLHAFRLEIGYHPGPGLAEGDNGILFGTVERGGEYDQGGIFSIDSDGANFTLIKSFVTEEEGDDSHTALMVGDNGFLYGGTTGGGVAGEGNLFRINQDGSGFSTILSFDDSLGKRPNGRLLQHSDGFLYGTTSTGSNGSFSGGIYKIHPDGSGFDSVFNFTPQVGSVYEGELVEGSSQELIGFYSSGSTFYGGIFSVQTDGANFTSLHEFAYDVNGVFDPAGSPIVGNDGKIYGVCSASGAFPGAIFRIDQDGSNLEAIHTFNGTDGAFVYDPLVQDANGTLFSTAGGGGLNDGGLIYGIEPDGSDFATLKDFGETSRGASPKGNLILASDGQIYGLASEGGEYGKGVIFGTDGFGGNYSVLYDFSGIDGATPLGTLLEGQDGALYGMTSEGGILDLGVLFKINKDGSNYTILYEFQDDGVAQPASGLVQLSDGTLIGTTSEQGFLEYGAIFSIDSDGSDFEVLKLWGLPSQTTNSSPLLHSNGRVYGQLNKNIWEYDLATDSVRIFYDFPTLDVKLTSGDLLQGSDGAIYGMTRSGNSGSIGRYGAIYKINPDTSGFTVLHEFEASTGYYPVGGLTEGSDGLIYGMATSGGNPGGLNGYGAGVVFRIAKDGTGYEVIKFLNNGLGTEPTGNLLVVPGTNSITSPLASFSVSIFPNPTRDRITIRTDIETGGTIQLIDLQGRKLLSQALEIQENSGEMDLSAFPAGTYIVMIETNGEIARQKVIKW